MTSPTKGKGGGRAAIKALLRQYGVHPRRSLGQNFLVDEKALARIVEAAELTTEDWVLEVGAGLGTLTRALAEAAGQVVAVEIDPRLVAILRQSLADFPNVHLVEGDIFAFRLEDLFAPLRPSGQPSGELPPPLSYKVVANIPYFITSPLLRYLMEAPHKPTLMVLTLQRDVAERITARPGRMSSLAVAVQFYGEPEIIARLKPGTFYPPPKVESAVVRVRAHRQPIVEVADVRFFFRVVQAGFSQRRKQLRNALSGGLARPKEEIETALHQAGIDPRRRAETLSLEEWTSISQALSSS